MNTKEAVICQLIKSGGYVSGETLGETLGISRAAVNMAIRALRADGYEIDSSTNKGYILLSSPDVISCGGLSAYLPEDRIGKIFCYDCVNSTNTVLRELALAGAEAGRVVTAEAQTAGRGRMGRQFVSPKGKGVYISYLMRPDGVLPANATSLTALVAVAISRAVEKVCSVRPDIKWVNDLVFGGKKICGILTEMSIESESGHIQYIVIGAGLNVNETADDFPEELREKATSLFAETGKRFKRAQIAAEIIKQLDLLSIGFPDNRQSYFDAYKKNCVTLKKNVRIMNKQEDIGFAEDLTENFELVVRLDNGSVKTVSSGEVSVRGEKGYV